MPSVQGKCWGEERDEDKFDRHCSLPSPCKFSSIHHFSDGFCLHGSDAPQKGYTPIWEIFRFLKVLSNVCLYDYERGEQPIPNPMHAQGKN